MDPVKRCRQAVDVAGLLMKQPGQARHLRRLLRTIGRPPLTTRLPWLAFDVIDWLETVVSADTVVFEYGGGGSTAFFADRASQVVTVESDIQWANTLTDALRNASNVEVHLANSNDAFIEYVAAIDSFPDEMFDLVLIDGRERVECVKHAMPKIKVGGWLVLDDTERERYREAHRLLAGWPRRDFCGLAPGKSEAGRTTSWQKSSRRLESAVGTQPT